jgi:hypothetical protein
MSTTLGYSTKPTWGQAYYNQGGANQNGVIVTAPSGGQITGLGAWIYAAYGTAAIPFRLTLWDATSNLVVAETTQFPGWYSSPMDAPVYEHPDTNVITPYVCTTGQTFLVGWAHGNPNSNTSWLFPVNNTRSYYDSGSSYQSGWPTTFGSRVSNPYEIAAYAYFSPADLGTAVVTVNSGIVTVSWTALTGSHATGYLIPYHPGVSTPAYPSDPYFVWTPIANNSVSFPAPSWLTGTWSTMVIAVDDSRTIYAQSTVANFTI